MIRQKDLARELGLSTQNDPNQENKELVKSKTGIMRSLKPLDRIPGIEWWDKEYLLEGQTTFNENRTLNIEELTIDNSKFNVKKINHLILHPIPIKNEFME